MLSILYNWLHFSCITSDLSWNFRGERGRGGGGKAGFCYNYGYVYIWESFWGIFLQLVKKVPLGLVLHATFWNCNTKWPSGQRLRFFKVNLFQYINRQNYNWTWRQVILVIFNYELVLDLWSIKFLYFLLIGLVDQYLIYFSNNFKYFWGHLGLSYDCTVYIDFFNQLVPLFFF